MNFATAVSLPSFFEEPRLDDFFDLLERFDFDLLDSGGGAGASLGGGGSSGVSAVGIVAVLNPTSCSPNW